MALKGKAIECVEEDQHFPFQWWCLRDSWSLMKNSLIIKVVRKKKMYFIVNHVKYVIYSFNRVQTQITFI